MAITSFGTLSADAQMLQKAMGVGYGTDSATIVNGRALTAENCEVDTLNVMAEQKQDCKMMNSMKKTVVRSTVHEMNIRDDEGDYRHGFVGEGGQSQETSQSIKRKIFTTKYIQTLRGVTLQMETVNTFEDAYQSEKIAGIDTVIKVAESAIFHGDENVVPEEFSGFLASIKAAPKAEQNILSLRGKSLSSYGEKVFDEIATMAFTKGGNIDKVMFPPVLSKDVKDLTWEKTRYVIHNEADPLPPYRTAIGSTIRCAGDDAGVDRFYRVKGEVFPDGNEKERPCAPASVKGSIESSVEGSLFTADDKGSYYYTVYPVNKFGIGEGTVVSAGATTTAAAMAIAAAGDGVKLVITQGAGVPATGFIICRSLKGAAATDKLMEMTRIKATGTTAGSTTEFIDKNEELPGTASMLFLPQVNSISRAYGFGQLLPVSTRPLYPTNSAVTPFLVILYGMLEVRVPKFCALVQDIAYTGGLY